MNAVHEGYWRFLSNTAADREGSIHDDEPARKLGFRGAFVPGTVVASSAMPGVVAHFGRAWMEGGWYRFNFVSPVYTNEEVREVADAGEGADVLAIRVETRDGRLCCDARAGLGYRPPWDAASDGANDEIFPDIELGFEFDPVAFEIDRCEAHKMLDAAGDESAWFRSRSPWGEPVAPPEHLMAVALHATPWQKLPIRGTRPPGMWAEHALAIREPLRYATPYRLEERTADKGISRRCAYLTCEFRVLDDADREIAIGRQKNKWLLAS